MSGRRRIDRRLWILLVVLAAISLAWLLLGLGMVVSTIPVGQRGELWSLLGERLVLLPLAWCIGMSAMGWVLWRWFEQSVMPAARLAESARVLLTAEQPKPVEAQGGPETRAMAEVLNGLVAQRESLRQSMDARVREAALRIEQERQRLAALMSELTQSVVVCNLDGRILLYNQRARQQFREISPAPEVAGGTELIGLGRSIYAVFDQRLIGHALDHLRQRIGRGAAQPTAQFVTSTAAGQLLRVQVAPVRNVADEEAKPDRPLSGFVLVLENITREFEAEAAKDRVVHLLTERSRAALASMQAALDMLDYPDLDAATRERFLGVIRDETRTLAQRISQITAEAGAGLATHWPREEMLAQDFVSVALKKIEELAGVPASADEVDDRLWLRVESFSLLQALCYLAGRLVDEFGVRFVHLRLTKDPSVRDKAHLDLVWTGHAMSNETVMSWELDPMTVGGEPLALTIRDVVERQDGVFWFERERQRHRAFFRFLLPTVEQPQEAPQADTLTPGGGRPEYYDFDLFRTTPGTEAMDDRLLSDLAYTVFDTETTGLNPSEGDRIIQIGAVRIVNLKLLRQECFEQLIDPQRPIPAHSVTIHGIRHDMVKGQPTIDKVLPAFHAYARDTVLVAHNAAFDMRFLQLQEADTGLVFDHPVLDTLLLSALLHPNQASHQLEAIAARLGVPVMGRHTALGDALVTAEVFMRLVPLLAEQGIRTLGQAREAAQRTYYARLRY